MIIWPSVLPQYLNVDGYQEQAGNQMLRSSMDAGPQKVRRRFTAAPRPLSAQLLLTPEQLTFFKHWFDYVLLGGTLRFGWVDPWSNNVITNLVTNGGFDSDTIGWTTGDGTITSVSGGVYGNCLQLTRTGADAQSALQAISFTAGHTYNISGYVKVGTVEDSAFQIAWESYDEYISGVATSIWKEYNFEFIPVTVGSLYLIKNNSTEGTIFFDEVTMVDLTDPSGIVEMRFVEPPSWDTQDGLNITLNMSLEILP